VKPTLLEEILFKIKNADPLLLFVTALLFISISVIAVRILFSKGRN
jgi:hypothetical protein